MAFAQRLLEMTRYVHLGAYSSYLEMKSSRKVLGAK